MQLHTLYIGIENLLQGTYVVFRIFELNILMSDLEINMALMIGNFNAGTLKKYCYSASCVKLKPFLAYLK